MSQAGWIYAVWFPMDLQKDWKGMRLFPRVKLGRTGRRDEQIRISTYDDSYLVGGPVVIAQRWCDDMLQEEARILKLTKHRQVNRRQGRRKGVEMRNLTVREARNLILHGRMWSFSEVFLRAAIPVALGALAIWGIMKYF